MKRKEPICDGFMLFFSSWNQVVEPACPTDLDTNSDWCAKVQNFEELTVPATIVFFAKYLSNFLNENCR